jgi:hypothetical protein
MRTIMLVLTVVAVAGLGVKAAFAATPAEASVQACPEGQQRFEGFCLDRRVIEYILCIKHTSNGRVQTETHREDSGDKELKISGGAEIGLKKIGRVDVAVENKNLKEVVTWTTEHFTPAVVEGCAKAVLLPESHDGRRPGSTSTKSLRTARNEAGTCAQDPEQLIQQEGAAVLYGGDFRRISDIFLPHATVRDAAKNKTWPAPIDRYRQELGDKSFTWAVHLVVVPKKVVGTTAYYTSESHGAYMVGRNASGAVEYHNPGESDHWTVELRGNCWRIKEFVFNAAGETFPPSGVSP